MDTTPPDFIESAVNAFLSTPQLADPAVLLSNQRNLVRCLSDSQAIDYVYSKVLELGREDTCRTPRVAAFLVAYLPSYPPSSSILHDVAEFCTETLASHTYIRGLARTLVHARTLSSKLLGLPTPSQDENIPTGPSRPGLVIAHLMCARPSSVVFPQELAPCTLLQSSLFGSHLRRTPQPPAGTGTSAHVSIRPDPELDLSDALQLTDIPATQRKIDTVGWHKKCEELAAYRESGSLPVHRKGPHLFNYKFYSEQDTLKLRAFELELVFDTIVRSCVNTTPPPAGVSFADGFASDPAGNDASSARIAASQIAIKLFMDIIVHGSALERAQIICPFLEMLQADHADVRAHAFNLLFNLGCHVHLLTESELQHIWQEEGVHDPQLESGTNAIENIIEELFLHCAEMALALVQRHESDAAVWSVCINAIMFFVAVDGSLLMERVLKLDPRVVAALATQNQCVVAERYFIRMVAARVYGPDNSLDLEILSRLGGISFIIKMYLRVRSLEAKRNLFVVLFDYTVSMLRQRKQHRHITPADPQIVVIFELMKRFRAAELFPAIFKFLPDKLVETLVRFMFFEKMKRDPKYSDICGHLDKTLIVAFLYEMEKLASQHNKLVAEFETRCGEQLRGDLSEEHFSILQSLLNSNDESDRHQGQLWLFALYKNAQSDSLTALRDKVDGMIDSLVLSPNPQTRRVYLDFTDCLILMYKNKLQSCDDPRLTTLFRPLNRNLSRMVVAREKNVSNIMCIFDMVLSFVGIRASSLPTDPYEDTPRDTDYALFLHGELIIPLYLLKFVNLSVFYHLFVHLPEKTFADARAMLLLLIIEKCRNATLFDSIGGVKFFRGLVSDRDAKVAYYASRFLLQQVMEERPDQYKSILTELAATGEATEELLENPYLQINAISRVSGGA
eukprot:gnl/Spiro4/16687_TR8974_c0_g1_i1.p1 gnl/Spiro4/16687_TR8974_c0_g1~~gnl/Spiro4/16687_TR8974_c0_g1_i1.p1  ORF type:complete len:922 (-),score=164.29 gnl/Spiro4/16687_TR8974_c0_g1_i1:196-2910(-)